MRDGRGYYVPCRCDLDQTKIVLKLNVNSEKKSSKKTFLDWIRSSKDLAWTKRENIKYQSICVPWLLPFCSATYFCRFVAGEDNSLPLPAVRIFKIFWLEELDVIDLFLHPSFPKLKVVMSLTYHKYVILKAMAWLLVFDCLVSLWYIRRSCPLYCHETRLNVRPYKQCHSIRDCRERLHNIV